MFDGLYFEFPRLAFLIFFFIACETLCKMRLPSLYFPHAAKFMQGSIAASKMLFFLKWLTIVMMILALMSPVIDDEYVIEPKKGHEIVLIIDASESMNARGFDATQKQKSRFDVVKQIVSDFIQKRKSDNLGVVVFGSYSFIASPLTFDENILSRIVSELQVGMAGKFTALNESLAQAINLLKMSQSDSKIAILLTDGHSSVGIDTIPLQVALDMAKKEGVKVYPIGIGSQKELQSKRLLEIAKETEGIAFRATSAKELVDIYKKIDALEKVELKNETFTYMNYYYFYPLFIALFSLVLYVYLRNKRGVN